MINEKEIKQKVYTLFKNWSGTLPDESYELPHSGSKRIYIRLKKDNTSALAVYNDDFKENTAFIDFTNQFLKSGVNVPEIYIEDIKNNIYLIQDLGDIDLLSWLINDKKNEFTEEVVKVYKKVILNLLHIQIISGRNFNFSKCYPYSEFNKESILFDLNYFRSKYVDTIKLKYNKVILSKEFNLLSDYLLTAKSNYFMYRDFQARNILLVNQEPFFIDYQGGRKGPIQYDLVSLLFQAKARMPESIKNLLLEYYIKVARMLTPIHREEFIEFYFAFALIRVLQTFGAYGLRGLIENKNYFIESIPLAIHNLIYLKEKVLILKRLPELNQIIEQIINSNEQ